MTGPAYVDMELPSLQECHQLAHRTVGDPGVGEPDNRMTRSIEEGSYGVVERLRRTPWVGLPYSGRQPRDMVRDRCQPDAVILDHGPPKRPFLADRTVPIDVLPSSAGKIAPRVSRFIAPKRAVVTEYRHPARWWHELASRLGHRPHQLQERRPGCTQPPRGQQITTHCGLPLAHGAERPWNHAAGLLPVSRNVLGNPRGSGPLTASAHSACPPSIDISIDRNIP